MRKVIFGLAVILVAASAAATDRSDVMATVHQFVDGFNKGDMKTAVAACASPASIIDEFPPHSWQGPTACADWARDYDAAGKQEGITDGKVGLGLPKHVDITGDRAYVVAPVRFSYKQKGKPVIEAGSTLTLVLQKVAAGWRITAWAWAKH